MGRNTWNRMEKREEVKTHCLPRCPRCQGYIPDCINIHGHERCVLCHSVVGDCCQGSEWKVSDNIANFDAIQQVKDPT